MFAPVFQSSDGRFFIVASKKLTFQSWLEAVYACDFIIRDHKWNMVRWSYSVIDLNDLSIRMQEYTYRNIPVMVIN